MPRRVWTGYIDVVKNKICLRCFYLKGSMSLCVSFTMKICLITSSFKEELVYLEYKLVMFKEFVIMVFRFICHGAVCFESKD